MPCTPLQGEAWWHRTGNRGTNPDKETEAEDWSGSDKDRTQVLLLTFTIEVTKRRELNHTPIEQGRQLTSRVVRWGQRLLAQRKGGRLASGGEGLWGSCACLLEV